MTLLTLLLLGGVSAVALFAVARWAQPHSSTDQNRSLSFSPDLLEGEVIALLDVVAALPRSSRVTFDIVVQDGELRFWVSAAPEALATLESSLAGIAPHALISREVPTVPSHTATAIWKLRWRRRGGVLLRTDASNASTAALLGGLTSANPNEVVVLSHQLRPRRGQVTPSPFSQSSTASANDFRRKQMSPSIEFRATVQVWTSSEVRARALLARIAAPLRSRIVQGTLRVDRGGALSQFISSYIDGPSAPLTSAEAVGILGWPIGGPQLSGLSLDAAPRLAPSSSIPTSRSKRSSRVFGVTNVPGLDESKLIQPTAGSTCHSLIVGPSGSGKSWLLANLFAADAAADNAVVLVDMKGDTATDALALIPEHHQKDVVVVEPASGGPVPGLRTFGGSPELSADLWLSVFRGLFPENFGIRSQRYLRMGLSTLARVDKDATIAELPRLFQDAGFRRRLVARLDDPLLIGEWAAFEQLSAAQQSEHLLPALGKVSEVLARRSVRATLAQARPRITIAAAIRARKIVVVSLPPGVIGQPAAQLLGALVIFEVWQAVMARQSVPPTRRPHVALLIDEPAVLGGLPIPLDTLLETARGMNCGVTMSAQSMRQLPERVSRAALTNAATIATFRPSQADAALIARELPGLTAEQLQRLDPFTIALRLGLASGVVAPVCTAKTLPLREPTSDPDEIRRLSADRYGAHPDDVDAQLRLRLMGHKGEKSVHVAPIGEIGGES